MSQNFFSPNASLQKNLFRKVLDPPPPQKKKKKKKYSINDFFTKAAQTKSLQQ